MTRYLRITMGVEVEVADDTTDDQAASTVDVVRGLVQHAIKDAVHVEVDDWDLSKPVAPSEPDTPSPGEGYGWVPGVGWRRRK